jgi:hypothetical protein
MLAKNCNWDNMRPCSVRGFSIYKNTMAIDIEIEGLVVRKPHTLEVLCCDV